MVVWTDYIHYLNNKNIMSSEYMIMFMIFCLPSLIPALCAWVKFKVFHACLCQIKPVINSFTREESQLFS